MDHSFGRAPGIAAPEHAVAFHGHDPLIVLVEYFPAGLDQPHIGPAGGGADFERGALRADGIARTHRLQPFEIVDAGRPQAGRVEHVGIAHHAHHQRNGMPAAGDQAAVYRGLRRCFVDMEWLRIELLRKGDDLVLVDALLADLMHFTDLEIFPVVLWFFHYHIVLTDVSFCVAYSAQYPHCYPPRSGATRPNIAGLPLSVSTGLGSCVVHAFPLTLQSP